MIEFYVTTTPLPEEFTYVNFTEWNDEWYISCSAI